MSLWLELKLYYPMGPDLLPRALEVLFECRRTLMYAYAFASYLQTNNQTIMLEVNQRTLEDATDQLSELLRAEAGELAGRRLEVEERSLLCGRLRREVVGLVHEGHSTNRWVYTESGCS
jgi:ariadne-1